MGRKVLILGVLAPVLALLLTTAASARPAVHVGIAPSVEPTLQEIFDGYFGPGVIDTSHETGRATFPAGRYHAVIIARVTGAPNAAIGWYPLANIGQLNQIFAASDPPLTSREIDIPESFGLWISTFGLWRSQPQFNTDGFDHFVVFDIPSGGFAIGIEDLPGGGDRDYNDHVLALLPSTSLPILDLPVGYGGTMSAFIKALGDTDDGGLMDSWFDHQEPTYHKDGQYLFTVYPRSG